MRVVVTGGCGFIGSAVIRHLIDHTDHLVRNVDAMTYAATKGSTASVAAHERYSFQQLDVADAAAVAGVFADFNPHLVLHLAAETFVDRSIDGPEAFVRTNVVGTMNLLQAALATWTTFADAERALTRFVHVSTDEVFGALGLDDPAFTAASPYAPRSPYAASKAAADHLVRAWHETYELPVVITNCSNNYGPYQFPEKLIPLVITRALAGAAIPVYSDGSNVRDWLYVDDHVTALMAVAYRGEIGQTYLVGGGAERTNLEVVHAICDHIDRRQPRAAGPRRALVEFVADRPGHDLRYAVDTTRLQRDLGWKPEVDFTEGLTATVDWYLDNQAWWRPIVPGYS